MLSAHRISAPAVVPLLIVITLWPPHAAPLRAQDSAPSPAAEPTPQPTAAEAGDESRPMPTTIGGMPGPPRGEMYTSPLQTIGVDIGLGTYALGAAASLIYLVFVYPLQALFGSNKVEPIMLWMLLPIAGPWMAQYESSVKGKPFWRGVLIADAGLQASGLVLGLIGYALSGRRPLAPARAGLELNIGVAGNQGFGLTLAVHAL
jgi:hypothetical protein